MVTVEDIIVDPPAEGETVDPGDWFDSMGPLEIEIGCGKGGFLLSRAKANPEVRLVGIEWANKYYQYVADRMARWQMTNVRVMRTDAKIFVMRHLPDSCVSTFHIYHPDPWPKKRHHKRRLFQGDFVDTLVRVLKPAGRIFVQTDHKEYFDWIRERLDGCSNFDSIEASGPSSQTGANWVGTNFEVKYREEGREIYGLAYRRRSD